MTHVNLSRNVSWTEQILFPRYKQHTTTLQQDSEISTHSNHAKLNSPATDSQLDLTLTTESFNKLLPFPQYPTTANESHSLFPLVLAAQYRIPEDHNGYININSPPNPFTNSTSVIPTRTNLPGQLKEPAFTSHNPTTDFFQWDGYSYHLPTIPEPTDPSA